MSYLIYIINLKENIKLYIYKMINLNFYYKLILIKNNNFIITIIYLYIYFDY